jgi:hypothetical protein
MKPPLATITEVDIIREELKCFYSRISFSEDILGIGIHIRRNYKTGVIEEIMSPLDLLSYTAFKEGVRETVYGFERHSKKATFTHWLPLCNFSCLLALVFLFSRFLKCLILCDLVRILRDQQGTR